MKDDLVQRIESNADYQKLVKTRSSYGWMLTWLMMIVYYGYTLLNSFNKELMFSKIGAGVTTLGMPIGFGVIIFTILITGLYVRRANGEFDELTEKIRKEVM
ncbi:Inner membrane protein YjcH [Ephemeroptericola cinctiostellae]|uniref:Inner membrane protein YjcH n=1 Tax=Ephemeroptericola cinctiostellae TaxID=2268024 RepID=A0A345DC88_9BURK|nr:DUF485 domain-containing protein [Ephemeroptericola cinctiostellae]AXF85976.1 Inner membrane protein YjcH [Ephemeroptericola cinctiostellae]